MTCDTAPEQAREDRDYLYRLISEEEAAQFLGYSVRALQNWRIRGGGPRFFRKPKRSVRYRRCDLIAWTEGLLVASTSEAAARASIATPDSAAARDQDQQLGSASSAPDEAAPSPGSSQAQSARSRRRVGLPSMFR